MPNRCANDLGWRGRFHERGRQAVETFSMPKALRSRSSALVSKAEASLTLPVSTDTLVAAASCRLATFGASVKSYPTISQSLISAVKGPECCKSCCPEAGTGKARRTSSLTTARHSVRRAEGAAPRLARNQLMVGATSAARAEPNDIDRTGVASANSRTDVSSNGKAADVCDMSTTSPRA